MPARYRVLWADDEIELLRPHILYLQERGYDVVPVPSGEDALQVVAEEAFDLVLLDERMPGLDGLGVLERLQVIRPELPVVMVTKQEDEELMEEALGRSTADFLTKPVNPSQVLSVCKRILEGRRIREETVTRDYTQEFARLTARLAGPALTPAEWGDTAEAIAWWSIQLDETGQEGLAESLAALQQEADGVLSKQVVETYPTWVTDDRPWSQRLREAIEEASPDPSSWPEQRAERPLMVVDLLGRAIVPALRTFDRAVLVVLDCLRFDQWLALEPILGDRARIDRIPVFSMIPSATPYARNALLSGRYPDEIAEDYPELWAGEWTDSEEGPNRREADLLVEALEAVADLVPSAKLAAFERVLAPGDADGIARRLGEGVGEGLSVVVVNFLDLLAHGQAESEILQELAPDPGAFRALARQWFERSALSRMLGRLLDEGIPVFIASDHGSVQVRRGVEVKADRSASHGLRYKVGRNLNAEERWTWRIDDLAGWRLPPHELTSTYLLAREDAFLVFVGDASAHRRKFTDSFQHGGLSLAELIVPFVRMLPR
jgi:CheY-like chemotaxis protein